MTTYTQAPLLEVIFEMRWGKIVQTPTGTIVEFEDQERELFVGQFHAVAKSRGLSRVERVHLPGLPPQVVLPHAVSYRFRSTPNVWPCYQIGLGIFTVNQTKDGYEWSSFRDAIATGLDILNEGHPSGLNGMRPTIGIELRYQDGFLLGNEEQPSEFLKNKLNLGFSLPDQLLKHGSIEGPVRGNQIQFNVGLTNPPGTLLYELQEALINDQPGFVMNTSVRSSDGNQPVFATDSILEWLEDAHKVQKAAFESFINPAYLKSFK